MAKAWAAALGAGLVAVACLGLVSQEPQSFAGPWTCEGENAVGGAYTIRLDIAVYGDTYELFWRNTQGDMVLRGLGLLMNDHLAVALVSGNGVGVANYTVTPGRLVGLWSGGGTVMLETCSQGAAAN